MIEFLRHALGLCGEPHPSLLMGGGVIISYCVYCVQISRDALRERDGCVSG